MRETGCAKIAYGIYFVISYIDVHIKTPKRIKMRTSKHHQGMQRGFVMGMILVALAVIAIVVAAVASTNKNDSSKSDLERAKINASQIIDAAVKVQTGFQRYSVADPGYEEIMARCGGRGAPEEDICPFMSRTLYNPKLSIMNEVSLPNTAFIQPFLDFLATTDLTAPPFHLKGKGVPFVLAMNNRTLNGEPLGQSLRVNGELYAYFEGQLVTKEVCRQIERILNGASLDSDPGDLTTAWGLESTTTMGCYKVNGGGYNFYSAAFKTPAVAQ